MIFVKFMQKISTWLKITLHTNNLLNCYQIFSEYSRDKKIKNPNIKSYILYRYCAVQHDESYTFRSSIAHV